MKIEGIKINNVLGARRVHVETSSPITLFAAFNGMGKSSIQEAVRMAFTGQTLRVKLKKEYATMVSEGAKSGSVMVATDAGTASYTLPNGAHSLEGELSLGLPDALPYVLNAQGFAALAPEERRTFLFALTNCTVTEPLLRKMLAEAECDDAKVTATLPLLKSITGFPAAAKFAAEKATEAKGAWRAITGETYGSKKAEMWEAETPEVDHDAIKEGVVERDATADALAKEQTNLGALRAKRDAFSANAQRRVKAQELVDNLPRLRAKLEVDKTGLADMETKVADLSARAGTAPRVGLVHDFARAAEETLDIIADDMRASTQKALSVTRAAFDAYVQQYGLPSNAGDLDAIEKLAEYKPALATMKNAVQNTERDIATAERAQAFLEEGATERVSDEEVGNVEKTIAQLQADLREISEAVAKLSAIADKAALADEHTAKAKQHHADVAAWSKLAEQLGPEGIPAQLLAQALRPINRALRESALTTGWRQATINPDMSITAEGRAYNLLCESEKWRVDAMIAEAIATLSGVKVLMLDRVDVLDAQGRVDLLMWLNGRAEEGALNSALLFATLKQPPSGLPENINAIWIENGTVAGADEEAAAA